MLLLLMGGLSKRMKPDIKNLEDGRAEGGLKIPGMGDLCDEGAVPDFHSCAIGERFRVVVDQKEIINVILDVGALFIDGTNQEIAEKWLNLLDKTQIDYAVYFKSNPWVKKLEETLRETRSH